MRRVASSRLAEDERLLVTGELSPETGYFATVGLLALEDPPTAVVAGNNRLVVGAISALRDRGLRIPDDLSLVGCDDTELTSLPRSADRHRQPRPARARSDRSRALLDRLRHPAAPSRRITLPTTFMPRASSALHRVKEATGP